MPDRRCLRLPAVRLRRSAAHGHAHGGQGGKRGHRLHAPGRAGNRADQQDEGLRPAGPGARTRWRRMWPWDSSRICGITAWERRFCRDLGIRKIRLMTNNPKKIVGLQGYGLEVVERIPIECKPGKRNIELPQDQEEEDGASAEHRVKKAISRQRSAGTPGKIFADR